MSVKTMGGTWTTDKYEANNDGTRDIGVIIDLRFTPDKPVDSKKIGLTQTVKATNEGAPNPVNDHKKGQMITEGEGKGTYVDQLKQYNNPMYATGANAKEGEKLADTPTKDVWGQHGHHYKKEDDSVEKQDALLKDKTARGGYTKNAGQVFETAALSLEGAQKDTFYGSVQWGWTAGEDGKFSMLPLSLVSSGVPTATFMKAADLWNKGKSSDDKDNIALPTSKHVSHDECYTEEGLVRKISELEEKQKCDTDPNIAFEITYLKQELETMRAAKEKK